MYASSAKHAYASVPRGETQADDSGVNFTPLGRHLCQVEMVNWRYGGINDGLNTKYSRIRCEYTLTRRNVIIINVTAM